MARTDHLNHKPDAEGIAKIEKLRIAVIAYEALMEELIPNGRELSLAKTYLETSRMWAVKGIVLPYPVDELSD